MSTFECPCGANAFRNGVCRECGCRPTMMDGMTEKELQQEGSEKVNDGYYYLHTNGDLIFKKFRPEDDSDFVKKIWALDTSDRGTAWIILTEALALGANKERVDSLAEKWKCNDEDAHEFAQRAGLKLFRDGDQWCATFGDFENIQEGQCGFGPTCLEALAELTRLAFEDDPEVE